ncbi:hypothetical protein Kpol_1052p40 [Vanderwaltozyma polyspora DSM 70294]|uniref:PH domain-containing protein n=1 Tax=Vanderwaltozyma polyspora (strain ATCC 22028 / DSM 70294 / BCRC 21397 / CBS 2163 / NBRC 10782 / NRRL Y-8283 / UCD 57-17) TaxID=436907 RepID=A7TM50_VANPO|nr:uncharacterized protein Kpol_1052p40 [Vanderwaltozyma polyspora DSM 70294]EDO16692.1 hypothetical protein Kpol_1052p40 [Vanderwaltozyma polyspora DSM 70294]
MTISRLQLLKIINDYSEYVNKIQVTNSDDKNIICIPRTSFTASRLMFMSFEDLAESSKTILLGGIPDQILSQKKESILRSYLNCNSQNKPFKRIDPIQHIEEIQTAVEPPYQRNKIYKVANSFSNTLSRQKKPSDIAENTIISHTIKIHTLNIICNHQGQEIFTPIISRQYESIPDESLRIISYHRYKTPIIKNITRMITNNQSLEYHYPCEIQNQQRPKAYLKSTSLQTIESDANEAKTRNDRTDKKSNTRNTEYSESGFESQEFYSAYNDNKLPFRNSGADIELLNHSSIVQSCDAQYFQNSKVDIIPEEVETIDKGFVSPKKTLIKNNRKMLTLNRNEKKPRNDSLALASSENRSLKVQRLNNFLNDQILSTGINTTAPYKERLGTNSSVRRQKPRSYNYSALNKTENLLTLQPKPVVLSEQEMSDLDLYPKHKFLTNHLNDVTDMAISKMKYGLSEIFDPENGSKLSLEEKDVKSDIIIADKVLVMVKMSESYHGILNKFTDVEQIDTRIVERWKEYLVIGRDFSRTSKCIDLEFYKDLGISTDTVGPVAYKFHSEIDINFCFNEESMVTFYNALDKTICIQRSGRGAKEGSGYTGKGDHRSATNMMFYIFNFQTKSAAYKWYNCLKGYFGFNEICKNLTVNIPDISLSLTLNLQEEDVNQLDIYERNESNYLNLIKTSHGYKVIQTPIIRYLNLIIFTELRKIGLHSQLDEWIKNNMIMGCNLKYYDRLEWSPESEFRLLTCVNIFRNLFSLEYRPYSHHPRSIDLENGKKENEPVNIEGYLIKFSDRFGNDISRFGRMYMRPSYFLTCDNILFSVPASKATPPCPLEYVTTNTINSFDNDTFTNSEKDTFSSENIFEQNPYPLNTNNVVDWVEDSQNNNDFIKNDSYAKMCFKRRVSQIFNSDSILNLTDIKNISRGDPEEAIYSKKCLKALSFGSFWFWNKKRTINDIANSIIFIYTSNGLAMKLLAPNEVVAMEWVTKLKKSVSYWTKRQRHILSRIIRLKHTNISNLKISEIEESNINSNTPKWIVDHGISDPSLYNIDAFSLSRPILSKGFLYQKMKKHSNFCKYYAILIPGFILLYNCFTRSKTGFPRKTVDYGHYVTIPLKNCYIYSGNITENDLIKIKNKYDGVDLGKHILPRAYADGWTSFEDEPLRSFTIWFGSLKSKDDRYNANDEVINSNLSKSIYDENITDIKKKNAKISDSGKSIIFLARSRQEKDLWVLSIQYELERLNC